MGGRPLDRPQIQPLDIVDGKVGRDGLRIDTIQSPETRYGPDLSRAKDTGQVSLRLSRALWGRNGTPSETGGGWRVTNAPSASRPGTTGIVRRGVQR